MAYVEKYEKPHIYTWKSLGITMYGNFNTVFYEFVQVWKERVPRAKETIIIHMRVKNDAITDAP